MSEPAAPSHQPSFSFVRVLMLAVPLALIVWGANKIYSSNVQEEAEQQLQRRTFLGLFGERDDLLTLAKEFKDADGDMLADAPADADAIDPEEIHFSYIASSESEGEQE